MWGVYVRDVPYFFSFCFGFFWGMGWLYVFCRWFGFGFFSCGNVAAWKCSLQIRNIKVPGLHVYL